MSLTARRLRTVLSLLLAGLCVELATAPAGAQQYYYQPSPDYYRNDTVQGTVVGGGLGAITGAVIGGRKQRGEGALIGAGVGALAGGLLGRSADVADQRQAAAGAAVTAQANAQVAALAVTNYDLVEMTRAGLSEDLIISTMQSRGGRFDMSPAGLISLKQNGVSDRVVIAAQSSGAPRYAPPAPAVSQPPVMYVQPAPVIRFYGGHGWGRHHHYHGYHGHHRHHGHGHW